MNLVAKRLIALSSVLLFGAGSAACGSRDAGSGAAGEPKATAPSRPEPRAALLAAIPTATSKPFHYSVKSAGQSVTGVVDAPNRGMTVDVSQPVPDTPVTLTMQFLVVDKDAWTKISFAGAKASDGLPKFPKKWMKVDPAKVKSFDGDLEFGDDTDPGWVGELVKAAADLTETAPGRYAGTTDLTKASGSSSEADIVSAETLTALADKAKAVPFTATVDGQGRLTGATVEIPAAGGTPADTYTVAYDQHGTAAPVRVPAAGAQVRAPSSVYELLND